MIFSRRVRRVDSMITLSLAPRSWVSWATASTSFKTKPYAPPFNAPILMTMSTSQAPYSITRRAS